MNENRIRVPPTKASILNPKICKFIRIDIFFAGYVGNKKKSKDLVWAQQLNQQNWTCHGLEKAYERQLL